jgi:hypothetical protein
MLVHTVLFWLKKDLDGDKVTDFRIGLETLTTIESAEAVYVGTPAATAERPVVDTSYDFCLTVIAKDVAAHDAYQVDQRHADFIGTFKDYWSKVQIYDAD